MEESVNIEFLVRGLFTASTGLPAELRPRLVLEDYNTGGYKFQALFCFLLIFFRKAKNIAVYSML